MVTVPGTTGFSESRVAAAGEAKLALSFFTSWLICYFYSCFLVTRESRSGTGLEGESTEFCF